METKVAVVILNWNGWIDTIECLESLFQSTYDPFKVIVCDNASTDDSVERIVAWCEGTQEAVVTKGRQMLPVSLMPCKKPLNYVVCSQREAETGFIPGADIAQVIILQNRKNWGYAGGNNSGLRYLQSQAAIQYVWLLNNDTVVTANAISALIRHMQKNPAVGITGSKLYYYHKPELVQACGGAFYNKWLGTARSITNDISATDFAYVIGASMMVRMEFLNAIGLLNEDYFLYYEELDWAKRGERAFLLGYAPDSIVYHKEGASAGTSAIPSARSAMSDYYLVRNRFVFAKKYYPYTLPTLYFGLLLVILRRIARLQFSRIPLMLKAAISNKDIYGNV